MMNTTMSSIPALGWEGPHATLSVVHGYQISTISTYLLGWLYVLKLNNPLYNGVYLATCLAGGSTEFINNRSWFLRITHDPRQVPLYHVNGLGFPLAWYCLWGAFFGLPLIILLEYKSILQKSFGPHGLYLFITAVLCISASVVEWVLVSGLYLYKYHWQPEYLIFGVPIVTSFYTTILICLPFWACDRAKVLTMLLPRTSESPASQSLYSVAMGFGIVTTSFFLASCAYLTLVASLSPWAVTGPPF